VMSLNEPRAVICERCRKTIELCAFCQRVECAHPMCYQCLRVVLIQEVPQPHGHGG
jgi:hypothetical protein